MSECVEVGEVRGRRQIVFCICWWYSMLVGMGGVGGGGGGGGGSGKVEVGGGEEDKNR